MVAGCRLQVGGTRDTFFGSTPRGPDSCWVGVEGTILFFFILWGGHGLKRLVCETIGLTRDAYYTYVFWHVDRIDRAIICGFGVIVGLDYGLTIVK